MDTKASSESLRDDDNTSRPLSVDIPTTATDSVPTTYPSSSVESSLPPSPTGILDSRTNTTSSTNTSSSTSSLPTASLNVKFAPLPKLAPRKRRSTAPLGMAARGQLMRRRRGYEGDGQGQNPMWTDEELAQQQQHGSPTGRNEEELEDPFVALGKLVKKGSKHIWRKVSQKEKDKEKGKEVSEKQSEETVTGESEKGEDEQPRTNVIEPAGEPRHIFAAIDNHVEDSAVPKEEEGRVWEEEIGQGIPHNVGQTETIVEGRAVYKRTSVVVVGPRSTSSSIGKTGKAQVVSGQKT